MPQEFTAKFKVDISDLKKNITEATKQIKQADDTFKNQTAGMGKWSDSAEGLAAKLGQLDKTLDAQKSVLAAYREQLTRQQSAYEENGKRAEELKAKLQELAANGVAKTDEEYKKYQQALKETLAEQQKNAKAVEDLNSKILNQETAVKTTESQIQHYTESQEQLEKESKSLTSTIEKQQKELDALKREYADTVAAEGKNSDSAKALARQIEDLSDELKDNRKRMDDAEEQANKLDKSLDDVGDEAGKTGEKFESMGAMVANGLKVGLKAVAAASASAVAGLTAATTSAASYADEMLTMSQVTGISTDDLQAYSYAAELVDVSLDTLTGSMTKNIKSMAAAQNGTGAAAEAYKKLGVSVTDSNGNLRDSEQVFWESIDALGKIQNETERDAMAMQLFGKSAQDLNPLINAGSEEMKNLAKEAEAAGAIMGGETLDQLGAFDDSMQRLKSGAGAAKNALGTVLLPALSGLADEGVGLLGEFTKGINDANGDFGKIGDTISKTLGDAISSLMKRLPQMLELGTKIVMTLLTSLIDNAPKLIDGAGKMLAVILEYLRDNAPKLASGAADLVRMLAQFVLENLPMLIEVAAEIISALLVELAKLAPDIIAMIVDSLPQIIKSLLIAAKEIALALMDALGEYVSKLGSWLGEKFSGIFDKIKKIFSKIGDFFKNLWEDIKEAFTKLGTKIGDAISNAVKAGINGVIERVENIINGAIKLINGAIGIINNIPGVNINPIKEVQFKRLEKGGVLKKGQVGLLEGTGAEAVVPLDRNKAWIHALANDMDHEFSGSSSTVNNYTQNIYAPKQPSRIELYRQSRNLFDMAMMGV